MIIQLNINKHLNFFILFLFFKTGFIKVLNIVFAKKKKNLFILIYTH